jgi:outer membrane protein
MTLRSYQQFIIGIGLGLIVMPCAGQEPQTPPIPPKTQDTPVPAPVQIPTPPTPDAEVPLRPLTAEEAARIALRRQPSLLEARAGITAAQGRVQQARSGLLPSLNINTGYTNLTTISGGGAVGNFNIGNPNNPGTGTGNNGGTDPNGNNGNNGNNGGDGTNTGNQNNFNNGFGFAGFNASATVRQLIFDFNRTRDLVRQSEAFTRAAQQNLTRTQNDLVLQVKQAFYTYQQNTRLVGVNEANLQNRQSQLALAQARLNSGLGLPSDVATAQTAVAEAVTALVQARANADIARVTLAALLGIDPRTPLLPAETGETPPTAADVNALVTVALQNRPEVRQAQEIIAANELGVRAARNTNAPVIFGSVGLNSRGSALPPQDSSLIIGASIAFSPFDGGLTAGRVKEARANLEIAQAQLASAQLAVVSDVTQAFVNLRTAEQRVAAADSGVVNAEEGVRIAEGRYRTGLGLFLDIINAQAQLFTARTTQENARANVEQARAALARAIGILSAAPR